MQNLRNEVVIVNESEKLKIRENAEKDYNLGMKYTDIATKYSVSINTVKSWKQRYKWKRESTQSCRCNKKSMHYIGDTLFLEIRKDLMTQLANNKTFGKHYEDLVNDYMELWNIKNNLIQDIKERGVAVEWSNGKQGGIKKNDSIAELNKTSAQMLKILNDLGIKPSPLDVGDDDDEL